MTLEAAVVIEEQVATTQPDIQTDPLQMTDEEILKLEQTEPKRLTEITKEQKERVDEVLNFCDRVVEVAQTVKTKVIMLLRKAGIAEFNKHYDVAISSIEAILDLEDPLTNAKKLQNRITTLERKKNAPQIKMMKKRKEEIRQERANNRKKPRKGNTEYYEKEKRDLMPETTQEIESIKNGPGSWENKVELIRELSYYRERGGYLAEAAERERVILGLIKRLPKYMRRDAKSHANRRRNSLTKRLITQVNKGRGPSPDRLRLDIQVGSARHRDIRYREVEFGDEH